MFKEENFDKVIVEMYINLCKYHSITCLDRVDILMSVVEFLFITTSVASVCAFCLLCCFFVKRWVSVFVILTLSCKYCKFILIVNHVLDVMWVQAPW